MPYRDKAANHQFCQCVLILNDLCNKLLSFSSVNDAATDGTTPLYLATQDGNLDCLRYLHSVGGKCDAKARDGMLPIHAAAQNGHLDSVGYLVRKRSYHIFLLIRHSIFSTKICLIALNLSGNETKLTQILDSKTLLIKCHFLVPICPLFCLRIKERIWFSPAPLWLLLS